MPNKVKAASIKKEGRNVVSPFFFAVYKTAIKTYQ